MIRSWGNTVLNFAAFIVCAGRAIAYSPLLSGPHQSSGPLILTDEGRFMPIYATLWAIAAALTLLQTITGRGRSGFVLFILVMSMWALGYGVAAVVLGGAAWMSFDLYGGFTILAVGAYMLGTENRQAVAASITNALKVVRQRGGHDEPG
ncbi:MAG: hypothetical protein L0G59_11895 [Kocuria sp.]|nr:hypothetical protein [Kocuria sp.]